MSHLKKYRFGFSVEGFMLVMLPNIIWMLHPPAYDPIAANQSRIAAVNIAQCRRRSGLWLPRCAVLNRRNTIAGA